jgi:hypothetical protein
VTLLSIWDDADGVLALDLKDLMALVAPRDLNDLWFVRGVEALDEENALNRLSDSKTPIQGSDLAALAQKVDQVIDGEFGCPASAEPTRVLFRAVDSTCWEVVTDDEQLLRRVRAQFRDVREGE